MYSTFQCKQFTDDKVIWSCHCIWLTSFWSLKWMHITRDNLILIDSYCRSSVRVWRCMMQRLVLILWKVYSFLINMHDFLYIKFIVFRVLSQVLKTSVMNLHYTQIDIAFLFILLHELFTLRSKTYSVSWSISYFVLLSAYWDPSQSII